ncbi:hypothetical protein AB0M87_21140 [Streptomyces sp. NPDC051320]|uniref:hypothetical protein n=1 Tax=Streptomyces sp. NPDC051320 TaxID=3154644 RepID=UPI0034420B35
MNRLPCATQGRTATAVAGCHHCGAAICQDHARTDHTPPTGSAHGRTRRIHCTDCATAGVAAAETEA